MKTTTRKLTVTTRRGAKATLRTKSSLMIECLAEAIVLGKGASLGFSS